MARIVVSELLTLDGVMQAPGDPNEDRSGGFDRGGWQLDYFDAVDATRFLLENGSVNGVELMVDNGWHCR